MGYQDMLVAAIALGLAAWAVLEAWLESDLFARPQRWLKEGLERPIDRPRDYWRWTPAKILTCRQCLSYHVCFWPTLLWGIQSGWSWFAVALVSLGAVTIITLIDIVVPARPADVKGELSGGSTTDGDTLKLLGSERFNSEPGGSGSPGDDPGAGVCNGRVRVAPGPEDGHYAGAQPGEGR